MTTSWTQDDIAALEAAIKGGTLRVRFGDREVQYQSMGEMLKLLQYMHPGRDPRARSLEPPLGAHPADGAVQPRRSIRHRRTPAAIPFETARKLSCS
jgi:hypothetical protein